MRYKVFNSTPLDYTFGDNVKPLNYKGDVIIGFDPSKTNMAVVIKNRLGEILSILEFTGNNWSRGPVMDTTEYCSEFSEFLVEYLKNTHVYKVFTEKAITKKGMTFHHSTMVLTEIRGAILGLFLRQYRIKVEEINNWVWKSHVLPDGFRSQSEKGSKRYFSEYLQDYTYEPYFEADVTDCLCILKYVEMMYPEDYMIYCTDCEASLRNYSYTFVPAKYKMGREFKYNSEYSVERNLNFYSNRTLIQGYAHLNPDDISLDEIYGHTNCFFNINEKEVCLLVCPQ